MSTEPNKPLTDKEVHDFIMQLGLFIASTESEERSGEEGDDTATAEAIIPQSPPTSAAVVSEEAMKWLSEVTWGETGCAFDDRFRAEILSALRAPAAVTGKTEAEEALIEWVLSSPDWEHKTADEAAAKAMEGVPLIEAVAAERTDAGEGRASNFRKEQANDQTGF